MKITRKYFVASLAIVSRRVGMPNRRIVERSARYIMIKNANKSSKDWVGLTVRDQRKFRNVLP